MDSGGHEQFSLGNTVRLFAYQSKRVRHQRPVGDERVNAIVRGERPLGDLADTTFVSRTLTGHERGSLVVSASDLAAGIINLKDDPAVLADWANFVLSASDCFEIEDETPDYWDRLIGCVWELAFGARLNVRTLALALAVRARTVLA